MKSSWVKLQVLKRHRCIHPFKNIDKETEAHMLPWMREVCWRNTPEYIHKMMGSHALRMTWYHWNFITFIALTLPFLFQQIPSSKGNPSYCCLLLKLAVHPQRLYSKGIPCCLSVLQRACEYLGLCPIVIPSSVLKTEKSIFSCMHAPSLPFF